MSNNIAEVHELQLMRHTSVLLNDSLKRIVVFLSRKQWT